MLGLLGIVLLQVMNQSNFSQLMQKQQVPRLGIVQYQLVLYLVLEQDLEQMQVELLMSPTVSQI